jgi:NAD-dependent deacetylase
MDSLQRAMDLIKASDNIVAFTGAGVSTESSIPDFRSQGGLYSNNKKYEYPPEVMLSHSFFLHKPEQFFDFYKTTMIYRDAMPNKCHFALARLENMGKLKAVITQNIDGLHQAAGSDKVLELHGSVYRNYCVKCGKTFSLDYVMNSRETVPLCDKCGGIVRPDVVLYEEGLDYAILSESASLITAADVLVVIGTSLVVYPAAALLEYYSSDKLILINKTSTPYDNKAQVVINEKAGEIMDKIVSAL